MIDDTIELGMEPIPQIAWWKQNDYSKSKRPIDMMPVAEIRKLYDSGFILCDSCGKKMKMSDWNLTPSDHVIHMINRMVHWACKNCVEKDVREGRIIGVTPGFVDEIKQIMKKQREES